MLGCADSVSLDGRFEIFIAEESNRTGEHDASVVTCLQGSYEHCITSHSMWVRFNHFIGEIRVASFGSFKYREDERVVRIQYHPNTFEQQWSSDVTNYDISINEVGVVDDQFGVG